jgi:hypothetical protein
VGAILIPKMGQNRLPMQNVMQTDYMYAMRELTFIYIGSPMRSRFSLPLLAAPPDLDNARSYDHRRGAQRSLSVPTSRAHSPPAALRARRRASWLGGRRTLSTWPSTT